MRDRDSFSIHDTRLSVWRAEAAVKPGLAYGEGLDWSTYRVLKNVLKENGFTFRQDEKVAKIIRRWHHAGQKGAIHFTANLYPAGFMVEFFEDVVRNNPNGARYDFHKMAQAPYLWKLAVSLILRKIKERLLDRDYVDATDPVHEDAMDAVRAQRASWEKSHGKDFYTRERPSYYCEDADGVLLEGGMVRWARTANGHLIQGIVSHNCNNMWWLVPNKSDYHNMASFEIFSYDAAKHPRKLARDPLVRISGALRKAVQAGNFLRAHRIQEAIRRLVPATSFSKGDRVSVDNPRFHGTGIVEYLKPPLMVGVRISNGHVWEYEWATVSAAPAEAAQPQLAAR